MATKHMKMGATRLGQSVARYKHAWVTVAVLSAILNILLLGGSIYMMLVYDSVLPSHSLPTLFSLLGMIAVVYIFQAIFDAMRTRILSDIGSSLDRDLAPEVQRLMSEAALAGNTIAGDGLTPMRDLDQVRGFLGGSGPAALIDLPWIIFFLIILAFLHIWLGVTAFVGALIMIGLTVMTDRMTKKPTQQMSSVTAYRNGLAESNIRHVELLTALGMRGRMRDRWSSVNDVYMASQNRLSHTVQLLGGSSKVFRMFLQSLILTVGALLVISGQASGGVIFASSILSGRALAPIDSAIANWRAFAAARVGWRRLTELLQRLPAAASTGVLLPAPVRELTVQQLAIAPPGTQTITAQGIDFRLKAGEALGIVGPSAAGKTSLARALVGVWHPARGSIRLDGAAYNQWEPDQLGASIGYLPQTVELLDGTVADNIARFEIEPDNDEILQAAKAAGVHDLIVEMPRGYNTPVGSDGAQLSAGQRQRIGLARALYRRPFLVLLDEPNSNLDAAGEEALEQAVIGIRKRGGIAIVIAHRPAALARVSHVLLMRAGRMEAFGPRDEVLNKIMAKSVPIANSKPAAPADSEVKV